MGEAAPPLARSFSVRPLLDAWRRRLQQHAKDLTFLTQYQAHIRQALLLAARQRREPEALWLVIQAAHGPFMHAGWVHTWARTLQKVVELWPQLGERYPLLMDYLASAWCAAGQWAQAQAVLQQYGTLRHVFHEGPVLLLQQAALLWNQGHWETAYRTALHVWHHLGPESDALMRVKTARLLLLASWRLHRLTTARMWGQQALEQCPKDQPKQLGLTHYFLFLIAWSEQKAEAEPHLEQAIRYLRAAEDHLNLAHVLADGTELWMVQGDLTRAEDALYQSYDLWREMEAPAGLADYYRHAARVAWRLGRHQQAREYADYALYLWQRLEHPAEVRRCQRLLERMSSLRGSR